MTKKECLKNFKAIHGESLAEFTTYNDQIGLNTLWNDFVNSLAQHTNQKVNKNWGCPLEVRPNVTKWLEKYQSVPLYQKSYVPTNLVAYKVTMNTGNTYYITMTDAQYNGLRRSKMWVYIWQIEGQGYLK